MGYCVCGSSPICFCSGGSRYYEEKIIEGVLHCRSTPLGKWEVSEGVIPDVENSLPREMKWQPIETAPRDGTRILCWCGEYVDICFMQDKYEVGEVWMTDNCVDFGGYEMPSHWMPLPEAPDMRK